MELEESTFDVTKESEASMYDELLRLYHMNWTDSSFTIIARLGSLMHKNEMIPLLGISDSLRMFH